MSDTPTPLYSTQQVADLLGVHIQTVHAWKRKGLIKPSYVFGTTYVYTQEDINTRTPPAPATRPRNTYPTRISK